MSQQRTGIALVICAPSGTGKSTLARRLLDEFPRFAFSVSCTTRSPREGEEHGVHYEFLSREEFQRRRDVGFFAEWAEVHGNFYGTPLESTRDLLAQGRDLLFDLDVQGASQLRRTVPGARLIFILPPSIEELERRLRQRGTETEESLARRLSVAAKELVQAHWFNSWIINDDLEQAWQELRALYIAATLSPVRRPGFLNDLLREWGAHV
ncbi:guanylate kinase [Desulfovibrio sp. OttesenSCG-928-F20]|nr:guanylate kinase [Desulfovibrio sp. OttesenSCG-928-M16]MDL2291005.1 guanylate kinase [Desulfovibrio sp. OttesenSCG-928-F20]